MMHLVITLRKEVPDRDTGQELFELVRQRFEDRQDIVITGHVTNHFQLDPPVDP